MSTSLVTNEVTNRTPQRHWWALAVLMLPVLLVSIDNTVLAFALPRIAEDFRPSVQHPCVAADDRAAADVLA